MSVDDRLRTGLRLEAPPSADDLELIPMLEVRAGHRRLRRRIAVVTAVAACLLMALALPFALREDQSSPPPVAPDTTIAPTFAQWSPPDRSSGIDGKSWGTGAMTRDERLVALEGTGLAHYGEQVFARAHMGDSTSELRLWEGSFAGSFRSHNRGALTFLPLGTFEVHQDQLVISFTETSGRAVFRWQLADDRRLVLTLVSTTAPDLFGAPAEVVLRMWSGASFVKHLGF